MSSITYLRLIALIYIVQPCSLFVHTKTTLTKFRKAYNSASEMF